MEQVRTGEDTAWRSNVHTSTFDVEIGACIRNKNHVHDSSIKI